MGTWVRPRIVGTVATIGVALLAATVGTVPSAQAAVSPAAAQPKSTVVRAEAVSARSQTADRHAATVRFEANRLVNVCNRSNVTVEMALGQDFLGDFASRGWWTLNNGECQTHGARYIRVYRADRPNIVWYISFDRRQMCVQRPGPFAIFQPDDPSVCQDLGGTMETFAKVPEGTGNLNWTLRAR